MKNILPISLILLTYFLTSCKSTNNEKKVIKIKTDQIGLLVHSNKTKILKKGVHELNHKEYAVVIEQSDSIMIKKFDILDLNANILYCEIKAEYSVNEEQLKNIAHILISPELIESYKILVLNPEIKSSIREICLNLNEEEISSNDIDIKVDLINHVERYVDISILDIVFNE